jgi:iron-sulfur cluster repair protein YtfE (RIC family)
MLTSIRRRADEPVREDAVDLLLDCHRRIRHFTEVAARLAVAGDAPAAEIAEAASRVLRYFTVALPKHSADEDESIAPRLAALALPEQVRAAVDTMTRQHVTLHEVLGELAPHWRAVGADPGRLPEHAGEMERLVSRLGALWGMHLAMEETVVFPEVRRALTPEALGEIAAEMRARREREL